MSEDLHPGFGDPDGPHELTKRDINRQRSSERIRDAVQRMHNHTVLVGENVGGIFSHTHDNDELGHVHPGALQFPSRADGGYWQESSPSFVGFPPEYIARWAEVAERFFGPDAPKPADHEQMRWRVRLFCGHVVERTAHVSHKSYSGTAHSIRCPECGLDPVIVVAERSLGLVAPRAMLKRPAAARVRPAKQEIAQLRHEIAVLQARLDEATKDNATITAFSWNL